MKSEPKVTTFKCQLFMLLCIFVKTLVNGIPAQLRKERSRIIREIDVAVDKAKSILLKRYVEANFFLCESLVFELPQIAQNNISFVFILFLEPIYFV